MYLTPATTTCAGARTGNQPSCGIRRCLHKASFPCEGGVGGGRRAYPGASEPGRIAGVHVAGDGGDLGNLRREARRVRPRIALEVVDARRSDHARFKEVIVDVCLPRHGSALAPARRKEGHCTCEPPWGSEAVWCDGEAKTRGERSRVRERLAGGEMCPLPQLPQRCTPHGLRGDNAAVGAAR